MIVIRIAITPSLNASSLDLVTLAPRPLGLFDAAHGSAHQQRLHDTHDVRRHPVEPDAGAQTPRNEEADARRKDCRAARGRGGWRHRYSCARETGGDRGDENVWFAEITDPKEARRAVGARRDRLIYAGPNRHLDRRTEQRTLWHEADTIGGVELTRRLREPRRILCVTLLQSLHLRSETPDGFSMVSCPHREANGEWQQCQAHDER